MSAEEIVLNIAVNMGRLSRWSTQGRIDRIKQFLSDTQIYLDNLEKIQVSNKFNPTMQRFKKDLATLKNLDCTTQQWAERALTWANILQHRAKLA